MQMKFSTAFFGAGKPAVILSIAFASAMLMTGKVYAQSSTTTSTSTSASAASSSELTTLPDGSGTGSSEARMGNVFSGFKKLPLSFIFYTRTDVKKSLISDSTGSPTSFNFVGTGYNLTESKSIIVRQEFNYDFPKLGVSGKGKLKDIFVGFNNTALASFAGDGTVSSSSRIYLPTGEDSRFVTKTNGQLVEWLTASKPLGKFDLGIHLIGSYLNQTQDYYDVPDAKTGTMKPTANLDFEVEQFTMLTYNFNEKFAVYQLAGLDSTWLKPLPGARALRAHFIETETGVMFKPTKVLTTALSFFNYAPTNNAEGGFAMYRDADSIYRFTLTAAI